MAMLTRVIPLYERNPSRKFPMVLTLEFDETPVDRETALAHLEVTRPQGAVVLAGPRGPKGGWPDLRFVQYVAKDSPGRHTLHLAWRVP